MCKQKKFLSVLQILFALSLAYFVRVYFFKQLQCLRFSVDVQSFLYYCAYDNYTD